MKKIFSLLLGFAIAFNFSSCSDDEYTDKYPDPSETSTTSCEKLMTGMFYQGRDYTFNTYWRMWTWENYMMAIYAQTRGFLLTPESTYGYSDSYAEDRWENFYDVLTQYRVLMHTYENLDEAEKSTYTIFTLLSEIYLYDHLSQVIDAFGDVPFTEAGYLAITGDVASSYPSYDKASDLYSMMLDRLKEINTQVQSMDGNLSSLTNSYLNAQDFINKGNLTKWRKYCNSLRLRLAIRVASSSELGSQGQAAIKEIIDGNLPLVDAIADNIQVLPDRDGFNYSDQFITGFGDGTHARASQAMLDVLNTESTLGENDSRLAVMYAKNGAGIYRGMSTSETYVEQQTNTTGPNANIIYSRIDSTTISHNGNFKSPIITAAEVAFLKAEAYQKGWASGNAKQAFVDGMLFSTQFFYDLNEISDDSRNKVTAPTDGAVTGYAEKVWENASDKLGAIITQKWLNFGYIQSAQAWTEVRRTGYPQLYYPEDNLSGVFKNVPNRLPYPNTERSSNTTKWQEQLQTMGGSDDPYYKLFWAK